MDLFIVRGANGQALGYFYFEDEPGRRSAALAMRKSDEVGYGMIRDGVATVSEVAELLGTSRQRVDHWCRVGFNPGRYQYGRDGHQSEPIDAKATRRQWLMDEFEMRLKAAPEDERVTIKNARAVADRLMGRV